MNDFATEVRHDGLAPCARCGVLTDEERCPDCVAALKMIGRLVEGRRYVVEWKTRGGRVRALAGTYRGRSGRYLLFALAVGGGRSLDRVFEDAVAWVWEPPGWLFELRVGWDRAAALDGRSPSNRGLFRQANEGYRRALMQHCRRLGAEPPGHGGDWHVGVAELERSLALASAEN